MLKINAEGSCRVYKNDGQYGPYFATQLGQKKMDGDYENGTMVVKFKKGTDPDIPTGQFAEVEFVNAWLKFTKEGKKVKNWYLFVNEYKYTVPPIEVEDIGFEETDGIPF